MNSAANDVKDMLDSSDLALVFATNLFVGLEPATPDDCVTIFDTPGAPPIKTLTADVEYYYSSIQIRVRDRSYLAGCDLASDIVRVLHNRGPETWNSMVYCSILCQGDPFFLGWENGRARFVVNFQLQRHT